jgi:prevent-host-death family protein
MILAVRELRYELTDLLTRARTSKRDIVLTRWGAPIAVIHPLSVREKVVVSDDTACPISKFKNEFPAAWDMAEQAQRKRKDLVITRLGAPEATMRIVGDLHSLIRQS